MLGRKGLPCEACVHSLIGQGTGLAGLQLCALPGAVHVGVPARRHAIAFGGQADITEQVRYVNIHTAFPRRMLHICVEYCHPV